MSTKQTFDLFLSHASEDKDAIARPLHKALIDRGVTVWFDEAVLKIGDSLTKKIDEGLAVCSHGIVILSPNFFAKNWAQKELAGLNAREVSDGKTVILPIWHDIDYDGIVKHAPVLADKLAGKSSEGIPSLVKKILSVVRPSAGDDTSRKRTEAIRKFAASASFASAKDNAWELISCAPFTAEEIERILIAATTNNQIYLPNETRRPVCKLIAEWGYLASADMLQRALKTFNC